MSEANGNSLHSLVGLSGFRCIVADPPWPYPEGFPTQSRTPGKWQGPVTCKPLPYPAMTLTEIEAMPVSGVADKDCRLWLWTTNRYLPCAFGVMSAWGFDYRQTLVWHKADGNMGGSVAPNSAEFLLVGVRGKPARLSKLKSAVWKFPQGKRHSRKPEAWQTMIETVSDGPRLELFARRPREGWVTLGNEADGLDMKDSLILLAQGKHPCYGVEKHGESRHEKDV
jgi:N6-adenosine-specific RNA methylase IME4